MPKEVRWTLQNRQKVLPVCQHQEKPILQTHRKKIKGLVKNLTYLTITI